MSPPWERRTWRASQPTVIAMLDAQAWLRGLPTDLAPQRDVIAAFLALARGDERIRLFVVGCSIGRGAADALSDVDALLGVREDAWEAALAESRSWMTRVGATVDLWQTLMPGGPPRFRDWQHTFAEFANGVQLDLSMSRAMDRDRPRADWVVLHDPDGVVRGDPLPRTAAAQDVRDWAYRVLTRLSACAKYLERGALWEAHGMVELARADLWRIWCAAESVADPQYGLTAAFDDPRRPVPPGFERTIATLDPRALQRAALAALEMFASTWPRAMSAVGEPDAAFPPLASSVRERLRKVAT